MKDTFWLERWEQGQIGFHQDRINNYLTNHWSNLSVANSCKVLVPLCGKSLDMLWLRDQGHKVLGVELSPLAVKAFFDENKLTAKTTQKGPFSATETDNIELLCGDFFKLTAEQGADIEAVYDRASLIALPPDMRPQYAAHISGILKPGTQVLLVTMEYPQEQMDGPPFSVTESEVHALYDKTFDVTRIGEFDVLENNARFKERGLTKMLEKSYKMVRK